MLQHVAQVWVAPIADLDPAGLFRLGAACLDAADASPDSGRRELLASVASSLLVYAGRNDGHVGARIGQLCAREQARQANRAETARVIDGLVAAIGAPPGR